MRKLRIRNGGIVVHVDRSIINYSNAVYLLVSPRLHAYPKGRTRILYIGRTRKGAERVLSSVSDRLWEAFPKLHGVDSLDVYIVDWKGRKALNSSRYAERAFLVAFRQLYGTVPRLNEMGKRMGTNGAFDWFNPDPIVRYLRQFGRKYL